MELVRFCNDDVTPVVPFGQGSSLEAVDPERGHQPRPRHEEQDTRNPKMDPLEEELGGSIPFMRAVKRFADPNGVLDPGNPYSG